MVKSQKIIIFFINIILLCVMFLGVILLFKELEWYLKTIAYICMFFFSIGSCVLIILNRHKLAKSFFVFNVVTFIIIGSFFVLNLLGIFDKLSDMNNIRKIILDSGAFGLVICFLILLFQVVILPAPALIFYLAVCGVYGSFYGFIICYIATIIGSVIAFSIGRFFGKNAVVWCIGKEDTEKYSAILNDKGKVPFIMMQLLPFFPDDMLCMVAGLSTMSYKFFTIVVVLIRPIYIAFICFLGTGNIIPYRGWGLVVWALILLVVGALCILYIKFQKKIDDFIKEKFIKRGKR